MRPKVSIIVPVYNAEQYLHQALQSIQEQTLKDIEVIIVDNHSVDNSYDIADAFSREDDRFKLYQQKENVGQNRNVLFALSKVKGEYIAEHDADDYCDPAMYEKLYNRAKETNAEVVKCGFYNVYGISSIECPQTPYWYDDSFGAININMLNDCMQKMALLGRQCHLQSGIAETSFIVDNNLTYRPDGVFEDTALSFKIRTTAERYAYLSECLYYYRKDNPASGSATIRNMYAICEQYDEILRYNTAHNLGMRKFIETMRYYSYMWNLSRMKDMEQQMAFLSRAGADFRQGNAPKYLFNCERDYLSYKYIAENS